jgi:hypothetical protein
MLTSDTDSHHWRLSGRLRFMGAGTKEDTMAFSQEVKDQAWRRAGGKCECTRETCPEHTGRCNAALTAGKWHAHHIVSEDADGPDTLSNCEALCVPCHENTVSYGG